MKERGDKFFWPSYADLMTSLFFIVLILFVLTYVLLKNKEAGIIKETEELKRKLRVYTLVERNIRPLKKDSTLFRYEKEYKRFTLSFDVKFKIEKVKIKESDLENYNETVRKIDEAGMKLKEIVDKMVQKRETNDTLKNVSYLVIISGYASKLPGDLESEEYVRSYNRAWNLWKHWKLEGINFEARKYDNIIDLQIAGNGWGGIGRFPRDPKNHYLNEQKNQRFIIQIVPKIGDTEN